MSKLGDETWVHLWNCEHKYSKTLVSQRETHKMHRLYAELIGFDTGLKLTKGVSSNKSGQFVSIAR